MVFLYRECVKIVINGGMLQIKPICAVAGRIEEATEVMKALPCSTPPDPQWSWKWNAGHRDEMTEAEGATGEADNQSGT